MKLSDITKRSARNLRNAKLRTLLTALAISVGAFTLTLTLAAGNGVRDYTGKLISNNFDPAELLVGRDREIANNGTPYQEPQEFDESVTSLATGGAGNNIQVRQVTHDDVEDIQKQPYIENVRASYQLNIRYVTREGQKKYTAGAEAYNKAQKPELTAGELSKNGELDKGKVILPEAYVSKLGFSSNEDALGKTITVAVQKPITTQNIADLLKSVRAGKIPTDFGSTDEKTYTYQISGISRRPATSFAFGVLPITLNNDNAKEIYDYSTSGTPNYEKYLIIFARVKDGNNPAKLESAKNDLKSKGYYVQSSKDLQKTITQFVNILQIMVAVFGLITVIASIFGIVNTQYISVLERTREIGLMKALGMSKRSISHLFMIEATWIGFIGGVLGSIAAVIVGILINPLISKKLDLGDGNLIMFEPVQQILLLLCLMLVATLAGLLPARKAAKMDPVTALKSE